MEGEIGMKRKKVRRELWWGVEFVSDGQKRAELDFRRHKNAEEAMARFSEKTKKTWDELEKQGAKVVRREVLSGWEPPDWFSVG